MSEAQVFWVGNQEPSIEDVITDDDGDPIDLSATTVKFKMRQVGSSTLTVNAAVSNTPGSDGVVRYDWSEPDVDTAGDYLIWWEVTDSGGKTQDVAEALIEFHAHSPETNAYVELEEFKSTASLSGEDFANLDIKGALVAASRGLDQAFGQRFYLDADVNQLRYYTAEPDIAVIRIDPLVTLTWLKTDPDGDGDFDYTWTQGTDFVLEPRNAPADGRPWNQIRRLTGATYGWPGETYPHSIEIKGKFGWAAVPPAVKQLTTIIASRLVKKTREAPNGYIGFGMDGAVVRASQIANDPEFKFLSQGLMRRRLFV